MDGDLLGHVAFATPANGSVSQTQPTDATPAMDLLGGSPIKTKAQAPAGSPIDNLQNGQGGDTGGDGVSQLPFSDNTTAIQTQAQSEPQEQQQSRANNLLDFPASSAIPVPAPTPSDPFAGAKLISDDPLPVSDPFAPPTLQTEVDASFDPFSDQPAASHPDPFAPTTTNDAVGNGFAPFPDQLPQPPAPDLFAAHFPPTEATTSAANPPLDPFAPVEQTEERPMGAQSSDLLGETTAAPETISAPTDEVEKSGDGTEAKKAQSNETTSTTQTTQYANDETSKLENTTAVPTTAQPALETPSDKPFTEMGETGVEPPSNSTPATVQKKLKIPPSGKEVPAKEEVPSIVPEEETSSASDPLAAATTEILKKKSERSGDSKEAPIGESQSQSKQPSMPQNESGDKSEGSTAIPAQGHSKGKASNERPQPKTYAATNVVTLKTAQEAPKAKEPARAIPAIKMGMGNQKLDFGMASNMFRSFSSKGGAQLKQLQSKGGVSLKVGLSRLGEASSNLAETIKQKNAAEKKEAASNEIVKEVSNTAASTVDNIPKATTAGEKKDEGNTIKSEKGGDTKAPKLPHAKDTSTASASTTDRGEKTTSVTAGPSVAAAATTATATTEEKKGSEKCEMKEKDVKQGITASSVTSLFGLKIEKLPTTTTSADKTKLKEQEKKKSVSKNVEQSQKDDAKMMTLTLQPEKQTLKEQSTLETEKKSENGAPQEGSATAAVNPVKEEGVPAQIEEAIVQKDVESKATLADELFEEKKQEQFENRSSSEGASEIAEVSSGQSRALSEQNAHLSARIATLEKELRASKEWSLRQTQKLNNELQSSQEGSAKQIQTLQKELQSSKEGSSRLIKSLEKKLHGSQETVKQLKDRSIKLQQGAEENELKKDLIEDLNNKLQTEMNKRQESETTEKKTKEKLDKVVEQFNTLQKTSKERLMQMKGAIDKLVHSNKKYEDEIVGIREARDEQGRRLSANTTQLNEAKKNAAIKVNAAEHYELKMNELGVELKQTKDKMAQIKFERDRLRKELGNWKKYSEDINKQLEGQLKHEKKLNEERKRRMKFFVEAKTEEARSSTADNVSLQAELDQTTRSLKDFNQRYKQLHSQWVQAQTRNRELQRDMTKTKNDSEKMSKVGGNLEAKLSRYSREIEDHKGKRLAAKNELMTVIAKLEEEKKANTRLRDFVKGTITPNVLLQHQVLQDSADHFEGGIRQLCLRFGREFTSLRRKPNGKPDPFADSKPRTLAEIQSIVGDTNSARILSKLEDETHRVNQQVSNVSTSVEQLESLLVAPTTKGCVGAMFGQF
ncbi:MAG: hypothetical protein SGBAC_000198 [Bacillariaceae sp.]